MGNIKLLQYGLYSNIFQNMDFPPSYSSAVDALQRTLSQAKIKHRLEKTESKKAKLILTGNKEEHPLVWSDSAAFLMNNQSVISPREAKASIFIVRKINRPQFEWARNKGVSIIDADGNGVVQLPGFHMEVLSTAEKKERVPSTSTPFTKKAVRVVRAFLSDRHKHWSQSELVDSTGLSQPYVSLILKRLSSEGYIVISGGIATVFDFGKLLDDWARHYRFDRHQQKRYAFNAQTYDDGLKRLSDIFNQAKIQYAFTGWSAAHLRAPYGIAPLWMAYTAGDIASPEEKNLYPVPEGGNLLLLHPQDEGVFQFTGQVNGLTVIGDPQLYVDLKKMPGRAGEQADVILQKHLS